MLDLIVLFSISDINITCCVYFYCIFLSRRQWMDCERRLGSLPKRDGRPELYSSLGHRESVFVSCPLYFVPYSLTLFLLSSSVSLISFLLSKCANVWENPLAWVPHFLQPYWMVLAFFRQCNYKCTKWIRWDMAILDKAHVTLYLTNQISLIIY